MGVIQLHLGSTVHRIERNRRPNLSCGYGRRPHLIQVDWALTLALALVCEMSPRGELRTEQENVLT